MSKPKIRADFLDALDHFATPRFDEMKETAHFYVTRDSTGHETSWLSEEVCRLAHDILDTEELNYLKFKALKDGLKKFGAEHLYELIMGEKLEQQQ